MERARKKSFIGLYLLIMAAMSPPSSAEAVYPADESISADFYRVAFAGETYTRGEAGNSSLWKRRATSSLMLGKV